MQRGGRRKGAGRPTDKPNRRRVQYKLDPQTAERFALWCHALRVPLGSTLESLLELWISDHVEDVKFSNLERAGLKGKELLRWYKEHPVRSGNLGRLRMAKFSRDLARRLQEAGTQRRQEKMDILRADVASGYKFAMTHKGMAADEIRAGDILQILGIGDKCTVLEIDEALAQLRESGELARVAEEAREQVRDRAVQPC